MSPSLLPALSGPARYLAFTAGISMLSDQIELLGLQLRQLVNEYATSETTFGLRRFVGSELALLLAVSPRSAGLLLDDAMRLCAHPSVMAKVASREWNLRHADAALDALSGHGLTDEQQDEVLDLVLSQAARTPREVRKATQAALLVLHPKAMAAAAEKADEDRHVSVSHDRPGQGTFSAYGTPAQVQSLWAALDAQLGPAEPGETRSRGARMFDLLMDCVCGRATAGQWQAYVVMTFETLTGASNQPAEIPGLGLVPAEQARDLAARAELRRVVVDQDGELVDIDSQVHRPDVTAAEVTAGRRVTLQDEQTDAQVPQDVEDEVPEADLAFLHEREDQELPVPPLCRDAFDRALARMLEDALVSTSASPASPGRPEEEPPSSEPDDPGGGSRRPERDGSPPGGPSPPGAGQREPDPPSPGDRAWLEENPNDEWHDAQRPPPTYRREQSACSTTRAQPVFWTTDRLRAALLRMLLAPVGHAPLTSTSYVLPPRMARHVKARDQRRVLGSDATPSTRRSCHQENQQARSAA